MWQGEREELGEEFYRRMNQLSERQNADWRPQNRYLALAAHAGRFFWCYLGQFCQIDVYGGLQTYDDRHNTWNWRHRENFDRRFSSVNKNRWWPYVAFALYFYSSTRLMINICCQYNFDFNFMRLEVLNALTTQTNTVDVSYQIRSNSDSAFIRWIGAAMAETMQQRAASASLRRSTHLIGRNNNNNSQKVDFATIAGSNQLTELTLYLNERVQAARANLKLIGAPYINLHFVVEVVYSFMFNSTFILVVIITIYYNRMKPFDYGLTRAFLDLKHERRLQNRLIIEELNKFIMSSRMFALTCASQVRMYAREHLNGVHEKTQNSSYEQAVEAFGVVNKQQAVKRLELNKSFMDHILIKRQLKQMALNGILLPEHRTSRWVDFVSVATITLDLISLAYVLISTFFFAFVFFALNEAIDIEMSLVDVLVIVEAAIQLAFIIPIGLFFISQIIANCVDQIHYSLNICHQIRNCIASNERMFHLIQAQFNQQHPADSGEFGSDLSLASSCSSPRRCANDERLAKRRAQPREPPASYWSGSEGRLSDFTDGNAFGSCPRPNAAGKRRTSVPGGGGPLELGAGRRSTLGRSLLIESCYTHMNSELLKVFMHYKIFKAQLRPLTRSFGSFASACFLLATLVPVNVRLHSPYLDQSTRLYSMSFNLLCTTLVDLCYIPLCYMYSRCLDLYTCQSSLLAHVVEVTSLLEQQQQQQQEAPVGPFGHRSLRFKPAAAAASAVVQASVRGPAADGPSYQPAQIYDAHTVWLLRKELNHPDQMAGQFAIHAFNMRLTYSNLLRIHFWIGILTLSMVVDSATSQDFFGRLFNDPLGVFNWTPRAVLASTTA